MEYWNDGINLYNESRYQEAIECNENALKCLEQINGDEYKIHLWAINFNVAVSLTEVSNFLLRNDKIFNKTIKFLIY